MARVAINTGASANDGLGDNLRSAGGILNNNFLELYTYLGAGSTTVLSAPIWSSTNVGIHTLSNVGIGTTNPTSALTVTGDGTFTGIVTTSSLRGYSALVGTASSTTTTFIVTVASKTSNHRYFGTGSGNAYYIDNTESPFLTLLPGKTYRFNQEDASNNTHPVRFYYQSDKTTQYTTNVTTTGTPGSAGAYTEIVVTDTTPVVLHYQCSTHGYMGNAAQFSSSVVDTPYQITARSGINVTGVVTATTFVGALTGTATTSTNAQGLTGTPNLNVGVVTASTLNVGTGGTVITTTTAGLVGIGTTNPRFALEVGAVGASGTTLFVNGDARVTGIVTIGPASITLNGITNIINVGTGITINGSTGIISATAIVLGETTLTGAAVTFITAGSGISVDQGTGNVTITATGGGGSSQFVTTAAGIHTLSNVGIGTTNPTSALTVTGNGTFTGVVTATTFIGTLTGTATNAQGLTGTPNITVGAATITGAATIIGDALINDITVGLGGSAVTTNTAIGYQVLGFNTSGVYNTASGYHALRSNTTGSNNTATGLQSLYGNTTGNSNTANGMFTLFNNTFGYSNTAVGLQALFYNTTGNVNTAIGVGAGQSITTGSKNTLLGSYTGNQNGLDISTSNNNVVLSDGDGNIRFYANSSGNVGLGTTNPTSKLTVSGSGTFTGVVTATTFVGALTGTATTATGLSGTPNLNVGIITATSFVGDGSQLTGVVGSGSGVIIKDSGSLVGTAGTIDFGDNLSVSAISAGVVTVTGSSSGSSSQFITTAAGIHTLSNVGIGTTNPTSKLTVSGDVLVSDKIVAGLTSSIIPFYWENFSDLPSFSTYHGAFAHVHQTGKAYYAHTRWVELVHTEASGVVGTGTERYNVGIVTASTLNVGTGGTVITTITSGLVGIGTTNPTEKLTVVGVTSSTSFYGDASYTVSGRWTLGASGYDDYTFVGIGFTQTTNDPVLYLARGRVYEFVNNSGGSHPFQIRVSNGGSAYSNGVTNNGGASGVIRFEIPFNAPNTLYYQCTSHSGMGNTISVYPNTI